MKKINLKFAARKKQIELDFEKAKLEIDLELQASLEKVEIQKNIDIRHIRRGNPKIDSRKVKTKQFN